MDSIVVLILIADTLLSKISRTFSSYKTETLHSLNSNSPFTSLPTPNPWYPQSISMYLTTLDTAYIWNHVISLFM